MRKLIGAMKVSLDMKFQSQNDYADWVNGWSDDYGLTPDIDACLLGGRMYRGYEQYWSAMLAAPNEPLPMTGAMPSTGELAWAAAIPNLPHYVLSRELSHAAWSNVHILRSLDAVNQLKQKPGKDIYLMGGGSLVRTLMDAGLVDEIRLITYPVIAGGSHDLFSDVARRSMELSGVQQLPGGLVRSSYRVAA